MRDQLRGQSRKGKGKGGSKKKKRRSRSDDRNVRPRMEEEDKEGKEQVVEVEEDFLVWLKEPRLPEDLMVVSLKFHQLLKLDSAKVK